MSVHTGAVRPVVDRFLRHVLARAALGAGALAPGAHAGWQRPLPDTTSGIHVFNDGLATGLSPELRQFVVTRYAGTQKMTRADADLLRAHDPSFVVLHYRLGMGLGRKTISGPCQAEGGWFQVIDGTWEQEWPGDSFVQEPWFFHWSGQRVTQCQWGWLLMDVSNAAYRQWWSDQVIGQLVANDNDGLFADSFVVPNFMGTWNPALPGVDLAFEGAWSDRLESFLDYLRGRFDGRWYVIPNVGSWVTSRDTTDYGHADGVFIEGFGYDVWESFGLEGWQIQNDRLLGLIAQDKAVIGQSYSNWGAGERLFTLATYLLIKGRRTFVNLEIGQHPEWFPEYEIPIGEPLTPAPDTTAGLWDPASQVYARTFSNGRVIVNPTGATRTVALGGTWLLAQPTGGGEVPWNGVTPPTWSVGYAPVTQVTLAPGRAAILVADPEPYSLAVPTLAGGQPAAISVAGATPGREQHFFFNRVGAGSSWYEPLHVTLALASPRLGARVTASAAGVATWTPTLPSVLAGATLHFQAAEVGRTTSVVTRTVR